MSEFDHEKVRAIRQKRGMTIRELADACNVSTSLVSQVERGKVTPTLTVFWRICKALETHMQEFFEERNTEESLVVRRGHRKIIQFPDSHLRYQLLTPTLTGQIEFLLVEIEPGQAHDPDSQVTHIGEECGYVLEGELIVKLHDQDIHLYQGDSIAFSSLTPHRFANPGTEVSRSIWAMTPPSF